MGARLERERLLPGAGLGVVWRRQLQGRSLRRDLAWACLMTAALLLAAGLLQAAWPQRNAAGDLRAAALLRWLTTSALSATLIYLPCAAVLGASSITPIEQAETTQAMLLTRLRPLEITLGRLLASLRPVLLALGSSCLFWMFIEAGWPLPDGLSLSAILLSHTALLGAIFMTAGVGSLGAVRRRRGRAWGRGVAGALLWTTLCAGAILLIDPQIRRMDDPVRLIESVLLNQPGRRCRHAAEAGSVAHTVALCPFGRAGVRVRLSAAARLGRSVHADRPGRADADSPESTPRLSRLSATEASRRSVFCLPEADWR